MEDTKTADVPLLEVVACLVKAAIRRTFLEEQRKRCERFHLVSLNDCFRGKLKLRAISRIVTGFSRLDYGYDSLHMRYDIVGLYDVFSSLAPPMLYNINNDWDAWRVSPVGLHVRRTAARHQLTL